MAMNNDTGNILLSVNILETKLWISQQFFVIIPNGPIGILRAQGKLIHEKNLKTKILCQTPFNDFGRPSCEKTSFSCFQSLWTVCIHKDKFSQPLASFSAFIIICMLKFFFVQQFCQYSVFNVTIFFRAQKEEIQLRNLILNKLLKLEGFLE